MFLSRRVLARLSAEVSGHPGFRTDHVAALLRVVVLGAALAPAPSLASVLGANPVVAALVLGLYAVVTLGIVGTTSMPEEQENPRRQLLFTAELIVVLALVSLYGQAVPLLFVLFYFPVMGFFQPVSLKRSLFVALFLSALYVGILWVMARPVGSGAALGTLLLLTVAVALGSLGERGRWTTAQLSMFRRCSEIVKRDVSFDELLADLLREIVVYYPVERVILVSSEAEESPGRLKQARSVKGEVKYEEIEFLREEVQYLFPLNLFTGFYANQVGGPDPDVVQYDFLENRVIEGRLELPKIFYTLFNVRSVLSSPILRQDRALGRIFLINRHAGRFTGKDIRFLKQLCDRHLRPILENLQLMEKSQALAVLEERNRIAMDLHDSFIQTLATLDVRLEVCRRILEKDTGAALEDMRRISQIVKSEYLELRNYLNKLRHYVPEFSKLEETLAAFIEKFQSDHGLPVEMTLTRSRGPLGETLRGEVLQIVREGLTNVIRHANATKAVLSVDVGEEAVVIRIEDNGRGMAAHEDNGSGPTRPWTILRRTQRLSGNLEVDSSPGEGTRISVSIPLRRHS